MDIFLLLNGHIGLGYETKTVKVSIYWMLNYGGYEPGMNICKDDYTNHLSVL